MRRNTENYSHLPSTSPYFLGPWHTNIIFPFFFFSARKRLIQKLNDEGNPLNQIIQISGHKNVNSFNNYSKINNEQSRRISNILANKPSTSNSLVTPPTRFTDPARETGSSKIMPAGFFAYSNFHGNVTFNFNSRNETQTLSQLTQQMLPPPPPANDNEPYTASHIQSPLVPPNRKFKRIRLCPDRDSE